jgi:hypothetical protein
MKYTVLHFSHKMPILIGIIKLSHRESAYLARSYSESLTWNSWAREGEFQGLVRHRGHSHSGRRWLLDGNRSDGSGGVYWSMAFPGVEIRDLQNEPERKCNLRPLVTERRNGISVSSAGSGCTILPWKNRTAPLVGIGFVILSPNCCSFFTMQTPKRRLARKERTMDHAAGLTPKSEIPPYPRNQSCQEETT